MNSDSTVSPAQNEIFPGEVFVNTADFDTGIRRLLPKYDEMLDVLAGCIASTNHRILELGCGTGELSLKVLQRYPSAEIVAVDYSPRMLDFARAKIESAGYAARWTGIELDFGEWANNPNVSGLGDKFNAGISSLAIHHLEDEMKLKLFQRIRESLNAGGCFWNADPVLAESAVMKDIYQAAREDWALSQGETLAAIRAGVGTSVSYGYSNPDRLATLATQLEMLANAGFETVAVPWKYCGMAVFGGFVH
ncbi:MAG: class I SAM-dependent methyltransferase [Microcoleus sp. PH2017_10_PVI_O_A]|uniref:class I SAM-dependent methyltransferase n=1 Tax=unclassified Microcoleus TaxID=2642155 RepID=UPI001D9A2D07|nr:MULTISPECIES: methyltransferase domain-containing protein [unclassified Microcoleus]TAE80084.1 MAG: class I SAM-dependent methyltransferase [Oscillatoriales cyanobacterium]MCC3407697.1 class I SAM-dependent methyltransferase [Microcoleus sp. PH2017_10_PVI_O_A]MCC3459671.1 class I SAM-dependent methyltransferase [Microcoleus sp. PH2017_11_PCY_U_A]MCC3480336.1 class I SAM-dependent methyltransferase [Microcoleus sp. PH2017_12_PCY_D_A]MCC3530112.1 class I SAM-dependent methyltransferase [Micro